MKYNINFILIPLLITASMNAMENKKKKNVVTKLTIIKNPLSARYITSDHILVSNSEQCSIVDLNNKEVKQLLKPEDCKNRLFSTSIHPNQKRIALGYDENIFLYNTETDKIEREHIEESWNATYSVFNPLNNETIFIVYKREERSVIVKYNYFTDKKEDTAWIYQLGPFIALHPTENDLFFTNELLQIRNSKNLNKIIIKQATNSYNFGTYNPDGTLIAIGNRAIIDIYNHDLKEKKWVLNLTRHDQQFKQIMFHPNRSLLAVLSSTIHKRKNIYTIGYWDIKSKKRVYRTRLNFDAIHDFSFSLDGKKLLLVADNKCIIMPLPIELFKEEIFMYWILKHYQKNNLETAIPDEIIIYIINKV